MMTRAYGATTVMCSMRRLAGLEAYRKPAMCRPLPLDEVLLEVIVDGAQVGNIDTAGGAHPAVGLPVDIERGAQEAAGQRERGVFGEVRLQRAQVELAELQFRAQRLGLQGSLGRQVQLPLAVDRPIAARP